MNQEPDQTQTRQPQSGQDRGNDWPVLIELSHALDQLLLHGEETVIDIKSLPFGSSDEQRLAESLGKGEVEAVLHALGESRICETGFPGVWWIEHRNEHGEVTAKSIEVTFVPAILKSQCEDVAAARQRMESMVRSSAPEIEPGPNET